MIASFWLAGAIRWRMRRGEAKVSESMSSVEMAYTCSASNDWGGINERARCHALLPPAAPPPPTPPTPLTHQPILAQLRALRLCLCGRVDDRHAHEP